MRKIKSFTFYSVVVVGLIWLVLAGGACSQNSSSASVKPAAVESKPENPAVTSPMNREVETAQKLIEKSPNAPNGYNSLSVAYIQ